MKFEEAAKGFAVKNLPESEVELTGEIPYDLVAPYRDAALVHIAEHLELPGFRPGKVPPAMALQKVGEVALLEEAVELFVKDFYPELVEVLKLDAVGRPDIRVTKLAPNNPVGLVVRTTLYPKVEVPAKWKKIHEEIALEAAPEATDEEVAQTLETLQKNVAAAKAQSAEPILDAEGKPLPPPLPLLDDAFAKTVGAFETLEQLKSEIKKGIGEEKRRAARDARRGKLVEKLVEMTPLAVPKIFVESELEKMLAQMRDDVSRFGMSWEQYLEQINKSEEAIRNDFREQATKRAKLQLILNKLAEDEKIEADQKDVEEEMTHALEHFPDAKPGLVRIHIETVLRNEKILKLLEGSEEKA